MKDSIFLHVRLLLLLWIQTSARPQGLKREGSNSTGVNGLSSGLFSENAVFDDNFRVHLPMIWFS